jgi:hypothetical protein
MQLMTSRGVFALTMLVVEQRQHKVVRRSSRICKPGDQAARNYRHIEPEVLFLSLAPGTYAVECGICYS